MNRTFLAALGATALAAASYAAALVPAGAQSAPRGEPRWIKVCSKVGENDVCNVQFTILTPTNQLVTGVNLLQSKGKVNRSIFQVAVPSGRYIPEGIKVKIDNGRENTLPYSLCLPDRCLAEVQLTDGLVKALKGGGELLLTSTNFQARKNPIKVTLSGFTAAFDGPPIDPSKGRPNQKLAEELKKKAEETRKKLEDAQKKAKSGG